jgi:hypothetical protein
MKKMKTETLRIRHSKTFFVGNDLVVRRPTVLTDTTTARAYCARFHPNAFFENGFIVVPA